MEETGKQVSLTIVIIATISAGNSNSSSCSGGRKEKMKKAIKEKQ